MKTVVKQAIASNSIGREWIDARRLQQRQRDWTAVHRERAASTSLSIHTTIGLGDVMIAKQVCQEFARYCEANGDPKLGDIVITAGAWPLEFPIPRGDHNVYWWWSMNGREDWLDQYLDKSNSRPDVVACLSSWCCDYAQGRGATALYLPLAVGAHFSELKLERLGIGYAGSKGHKDREQISRIIDPFVGDAMFNWVSGFSTPRQLCEYYNSKQIILGMTESYQERAGMVNNRVFEVLATGTPFLVHKHRAIDEVLGCPYPYQSESAEQTRSLADQILADYPGHLAQFEEYRRIVGSKHTYKHRLKTLINHLAGRK